MDPKEEVGQKKNMANVTLSGLGEAEGVVGEGLREEAGGELQSGCKIN